MILIAALMFVGAQLLRVPVSAAAYQQCLKAAKQVNQAQCKHEESIWDRTLTDPAYYYTAWVTLFTGLLVSVGIAQWSLISEQLRLGQREFAAAERRAADSLKHSHDVSDRELRAWVSVSAELVECRKGDGYFLVDLKINCDNVGRSPALSVGYSIECSVKSSVVLNHGAIAAPQKHPTPLPSLLPGTGADQREGKRISWKELHAGAQAAKASRASPMIVVDVIVYYKTVFDEDASPRHMTSVRYTIHPKTGHFIDPNESASWLDYGGPTATDEVLFAQDKSAPVHLT